MSDFLASLQSFRGRLHQNFKARKDAIMNLIDAVSESGRKCQSVIELSESPHFARQYTSITDAIADGLPSANWEAISKLHYEYSAVSEKKLPPCFLVDITPDVRPHAKTLQERGIVYTPATKETGNKPIDVGVNYSIVALNPNDPSMTKDSNWIVPMSCKRVLPEENGSLVGINQIENLRETLDLQDELCVSVGDTAYGSLQSRKRVAETKSLVHIFRLASHRKIFNLAENSPETSARRNKTFGGKMRFNHPDTHFKEDESYQIPWETAKGKKYIINIRVWRNLVFRGKRDFNAADHPLTVIQSSVVDLDGKPVFKRPMWIAATGDRRNEISSTDIYNYYKSRFDIEHFFRFGKQCLLMNSYQTPDIKHSEDWWRLIMTSYMQLYLSKNIVAALPKKWERYLPTYKENNNPGVTSTPSNTQRGFSSVLDQVGTPAKPPKPRGNPKGRTLGEAQVKRDNSPVIIKSSNKKKEKNEKSIVLSFEKNEENLKPQSGPAKVKYCDENRNPEPNVDQKIHKLMLNILKQ